MAPEDTQNETDSPCSLKQYRLCCRAYFSKHKTNYPTEYFQLAQCCGYLPNALDLMLTVALDKKNKGFFICLSKYL